MLRITLRQAQGDTYCQPSAKVSIREAFMTTSKLIKTQGTIETCQVDLTTHDYFESTYPEKVN